MRSDPAADLAGHLAMARFGGFHSRLIALCFLIAAVDVFDTQCISFVAPTLLQEWGLSRAAFGPLFSAGLFGTMLGAMTLGPAADRFGRKPVALACVILFGVMSLLSARADSPQMLGTLRFIGGIGLGGVIPNIIALVSEYSPQRHRATTVVAMFVGFPLGAMAGGAISHDIIDRHGWQAIFILGGVLPLALALVAAFMLPESARFLAQRGRHQALQRILARIGTSPEAELERRPAETAHEHRKSTTVGMLFTGDLRTWTLLLWLLSFLGMLLTYFLINWTPLLLVAAGVPQENAIMAVVLLNAGGVAGGLLIGRLLDRVSVFAVLALAFGLGAIAVYALGATLSTGLTLTLTMTAVTGFTLFGGQMNFPGLTANYYPVQVRSTGAGWAMAFGRMGSVIGPLAGGALVTMQLDTAQMLELSAIPAVLAAIVLLILARACPERGSRNVNPDR